MSGLDEQEFTPVENIVKSAFLYNVSIYFAQHPDRIREAFKDYFELHEDQTVITTQAGVFDGSLRLSIKKFKKIPPVKFDVQEYNGKKELLSNRKRRITVRCYGYNPAELQPEARPPYEKICQTCSHAFRFVEARDHDTYHCIFQKVCKICKGKNCLKNSCKHTESIKSGDWSPVKADIEKAKKLRNKEGKELTGKERFKLDRKNGIKNKNGIPSYLNRETTRPLGKKPRSTSESKLTTSPPKSPPRERSSLSQTTAKFNKLQVKSMHETMHDLDSSDAFEDSQDSIPNNYMHDHDLHCLNDTRIEACVPPSIVSADAKTQPSEDQSGHSSVDSISAAASARESNSQENSAAKHESTMSTSTSRILPPVPNDSPIIGDGNCLPRAVAKFLYNNQELHTTVRKTAWEFVRENPANFKFDYDLAINETNMKPEYGARKFTGSFNDWVDENLKNGTFGNMAMLKAITQKCSDQVSLIIVEQQTASMKEPYKQMFRHGQIVKEGFDSSYLPKNRIIRLSLSHQHYDLLNYSDRPCVPRKSVPEPKKRVSDRIKQNTLNKAAKSNAKSSHK
jgi:hypothetical protein